MDKYWSHHNHIKDRLQVAILKNSSYDDEKFQANISHQSR